MRDAWSNSQTPHNTCKRCECDAILSHAKMGFRVILHIGDPLRDWRTVISAKLDFRFFFVVCQNYYILTLDTVTSLTAFAYVCDM